MSKVAVNEEVFWLQDLAAMGTAPGRRLLIAQEEEQCVEALRVGAVYGAAGIINPSVAQRVLQAQCSSPNLNVVFGGSALHRPDDLFSSLALLAG
jgi:hypothetical protein